jgi:hypothetical protein
MTALVLGAIIGAFVALDPLFSTYLLRDLPQLHSVSYALSITAAALLGAGFLARRIVADFSIAWIRDYSFYFPLLFLVAYQFTSLSAGPLDPTDALLGVFIVLFAVGLMIDRDQRLVSTPFNMLHVLIVICITVSLVATFKPTGFMRSLKPFILFFLLVNFLPRGNVIPTFIRWMVVLAMVTAAFALLQEAVWLASPVALTPLPQANIEMMMETIGGTAVLRVPALMTGYRPLALYLAISLMFAVSGLLWSREARLVSRRWLKLAICLIVPALLLTQAKDILIGTVLGIVLLLILYRPTRYVPLLSAVALVGALAVALTVSLVPGNVDKAMDLARTIPKAEIERIRLDRDSIEGFLHGPYFWTGRGVFAGARYTAHSRRWPAHNAFILAAAEIGIVGVTLLLSVYALAFVRALALNAIVKRGPHLPLVRALVPSMAIIFVGAQFEADFLEMFIWTMFAVIEALWVVVNRRSMPQAVHAPPADISVEHR